MQRIKHLLRYPIALLALMLLSVVGMLLVARYRQIQIIKRLESDQ